MIGVIDYTGGLYIKRRSKYQRQNCPYKRMQCSDACPLFGEPIYHSKTVELKLCHATLIFETFKDDRLENQPA